MKLERGAATIQVYLHNGTITVMHGDTGKVLLERKAYDGDKMSSSGQKTYDDLCKLLGIEVPQDEVTL